MAPPAGMADRTLTVLVKAPIRSRPSDRSVRVCGQETGRQISLKAPGQSHPGSDPPLPGDPSSMRVTPPVYADKKEVAA